jgi:SAM-dependent methyltransferase
MMTPQVRTPEEPFVLVDHEKSLARLEATMRRVGTTLSHAEFVRAVSTAYFEMDASRHAAEMHQYFHLCGAYDHLRRALTAAKSMLAQPLRILDIGCGAGFELSVVREVFVSSDVRQLVGLDPSPDMLSYARQKVEGYPCRMILGSVRDALEFGPFELVVTHAMVHHVPSLAAFFAGIEQSLVPGGIYLMGHEPNRRYWTHLEKQSFFQELQETMHRRRHIGRFFQPSRYVSKLVRLLRLAEEQSPVAQVNRILRQRYGFHGELTAKEVLRLVDVHVPDRLPGEFRIGLEGFDWEELGSGMLRDFQLISLVTYSHLQQSTDPKYWPRGWRKLSARLERTYPLDGACFTALWRKDRQDE